MRREIGSIRIASLGVTPIFCDSRVLMCLNPSLRSYSFVSDTSKYISKSDVSLFKRARRVKEEGTEGAHRHIHILYL